MTTKAILFSFVVASISFFISHSELLERHRRWARKSSCFYGDLITCCYCLGHWLAIPLLTAFPIRLFGIFEPVDYAFTWFAISWMAGIQSMVMSKLMGD